MCGGTRTHRQKRRPEWGLSPRVRGNRHSPSYRERHGRSIPACAGEPVARRPRPLPNRVYPRVCGGTWPPVPLTARWPGLSPRVRGNLPGAPRGRWSFGSIPACAGEPLFGGRKGETGTVYPRVCGGTIPVFNRGDYGRGLSPRVRGNLRRRTRTRIGTGSIPACAGEPQLLAQIIRLSEVYPRVCGGTRRRPRSPTGSRGLSPRVRGNLAYAGRDLGRGRSIPACAGEPWRSHCGWRCCGVYPRVCGGTHAEARPAANKSGLSPRVRGNRAESHRERVQLRSIPACAGEPPPGAMGCRPGKVYPRVCGGTD